MRGGQAARRGVDTSSVPLRSADSTLRPTATRSLRRVMLFSAVAFVVIVTASALTFVSFSNSIRRQVDGNMDQGFEVAAQADREHQRLLLRTDEQAALHRLQESAAIVVIALGLTAILLA